MASTPILPLALWLPGTNQNSIPANDNALRIEALNREIISQAVTAQPASPADGDTYIIAATNTGAQWATFTPKDIAIFKSGTWYAWAPTEGLIVNVNGAEFKYDGGFWTAVTGSGMTNPMTTAGDIIYGGASGLPTRLAAGISAYVLTSNGAGVAPSWQAIAAGFTNPMTTVGDLIVGGAAGAAGRLAAGTSGYVLTSNGAGVAPTWQAISGGGLTGFSSSLNTSGINATINVSQLVASGGTTNQDAALSPKGTGSLLAQVPDGTAAGGNRRGSNAVDLQTTRTLNTQVALGTASTVSGGNGNTSSGNWSGIGGGLTNVASGSYAAIAGGLSNTASGLYSSVTGGRDNVADGQQSRVGGSGGNARGIMGADIYGLVAGNQRGSYALQRNTANATPATATTDYNGTPAAGNQIVLANNQAISFTGTVVAKKSGSTDSAHWKIEGGIVRGASAATTALVGTPTVTLLGAAAGASGWAVAIAANTTLGCLSIAVTGGAASNLNWTIVVDTAETVI